MSQETENERLRNEIERLKEIGNYQIKDRHIQAIGKQTFDSAIPKLDYKTAKGSIYNPQQSDKYQEQSKEKLDFSLLKSLDLKLTKL